MGRMLRTLRLRAGLTQQLLAELSGVSVAGVRDVEQGRVLRPRASTMNRLSAALGLSRADSERLRTARPGRAVGIRIEVLGPLRVVVDDAAAELTSQAQRALLGMLALSPNHPVGLDALVDGLWGARPPDGVIARLQSRISRLRPKLRSASGSSVDIAGIRTGYQLAVDRDQHDLLAFRQLVSSSRRCRDLADLPEAATLLSDALALWRGDPVADLPLLHSHPDVTGLRHEWQAVVLEYGAITEELGQHAQAVPHLRRAAQTDGLHEGVHAALMVALAGSGQQAAALALFDRLRRRLAGELGADPGPQLTNAHERVLRGDVHAPADSTRPPTRTRCARCFRRVRSISC